MQREGEVIHALDVAVNGMPRRQVFHAQEFFAYGVWFVGIQCGELATHHHGDDVIFAHAFCFTRANVLPVADDADGVGNSFHLIELVRNIDAGDTVVLQVADDIEQNGGFLFGERGGWLVEDQQAYLFI